MALVFLHVDLLLSFLKDYFGTPAIAEESTQIKPKKILEDSSLIAISQSGETKNILDAVELIKKKNIPIISISNSAKSSLGKIADIKLELKFGKERGLISTKGFSSELVAIYSILDNMMDCQVEIEFKHISKAVEEIISKQLDKIKFVALELRNSAHTYIIGNNAFYHIAKEGEQKFIEMAKIPTNAILPDTVFHKNVAYMEPYTYVIVMNPEGPDYHQILKRVRVLKGRGAYIIGISNKSSSLYDEWIKISTIKPDILYPLLCLIPIQLLAFYTSIARGFDPDHLETMKKVYNEQIMEEVLEQSKEFSSQNLKIKNIVTSLRSGNWKSLLESIHLINAQIKKQRLPTRIITELIEATLDNKNISKNDTYLKEIYQALHLYFKDILVYYNLSKKDLVEKRIKQCIEIIEAANEIKKITDKTGVSPLSDSNLDIADTTPDGEIVYTIKD